MRWRVLPNPVAADGAPVVLDGSAGLLAIRMAAGFPVDVLVARDRSRPALVRGGLRGRRSSSATVAAGSRRCRRRPALADLVLVPSVGSGTSSRRSPAAGRRRPAPDVRAGSDRAARPAWDDGAASWASTAPTSTSRWRWRRCRGRPPRAGPRRSTTDVVLTAEDGTVWFGRIGTTPVGLAVTWSEAVQRGRPRRRPPRRHPDPLPERQSRSGWRGPTTPRGSPVGSGDRRLQRHAPRGRDPGFAAAPGSSLRVAAQPWAPRRPSRSPRPSPPTARETARSWCGSTRARLRRHRLPHDATDRPPTDLVIVGPPVSQEPDRPLLVLPDG